MVHNGGDDIRASRAASRGQAQADARAHEHAAHHRGHELLVGEEVGRHGGVLTQRGHHREHHHGVDGLHAEAPPQYPEGHREQHEVEAEEDVLGGQTRAPIDDGRYAGQASHRDVVGQQEELPAHAADDHGDGQ